MTDNFDNMGYNFTGRVLQAVWNLAFLRPLLTLRTLHIVWLIVLIAYGVQIYGVAYWAYVSASQPDGAGWWVLMYVWPELSKAVVQIALIRILLEVALQCSRHGAGKAVTPAQPEPGRPSAGQA